MEVGETFTTMWPGTADSVVAAPASMLGKSSVCSCEPCIVPVSPPLFCRQGTSFCAARPTAQRPFPSPLQMYRKSAPRGHSCLPLRTTASRARVSLSRAHGDFLLPDRVLSVSCAVFSQLYWSSATLRGAFSAEYEKSTVTGDQLQAPPERP